MKRNLKKRKISCSIFFRIGMSILTAIAYFFSNSSPFFLWVAPLPLFILAINYRYISSLFLIFLAYFVGNFFQFFYTYYQTIFPIEIIMLSIAIESFFFAGILCFAGLYVRRFKSWYAIFVFPTFWITYLFFFILIIKKGNITSLPIFSQIEILPIVQIVSITGVLGLSFLTLLLPWGLTISWYYLKNHSKQALLSLIFTLSIFAGILVFGIVRLHYNNFLPKLKVGLAAKDYRKSPFFQNSIEIANEFAKTVRRLAMKGAEFILQPEKSLYVTPENQNEIFQIIARSAKENNVYVFVPLALNGSVKSNALYVFGPDGNLIAEYNKIHLVSALEKNFTPGKNLSTISLPAGLIGLAICHDMDFFQPTKNYSQIGAGLLFVPARDFGARVDGKWHAQIAILQSITGGFSLARPAYFGFLSATDPKGRILAWEPTLLDKEVLVRVDVPIGTGRTFYSRMGDWFPWLNCIGALFFLFLIIRFRKK